MMGVAAGLAAAGMIPFASSFAMFAAGRAFEQVRNSIGYPHLNVKIGATHAGISVGEDGATHQCCEDIALMRVLPHMTVLVPCDALETQKAVRAAAEIEGPVYVRVARPVCPILTGEDTPFVPGKANVLREGGDVAIVATGLMVQRALAAAEMLAQEGIQAAVLTVHTIKPYDAQTVLEWAEKCGAVVTAEEHSLIGGLASATSEALMGKTGAKFAAVGIEDKFGKSGNPDELFEEYGLTAKHIAEKAKGLLA